MKMLFENKEPRLKLDRKLFTSHAHKFRDGPINTSTLFRRRRDRPQAGRRSTSVMLRFLFYRLLFIIQCRRLCVA